MRARYFPLSLAALLFAGVVTLSPLTATAQSAQEKAAAREAAEAGAQAFDEGRYKDSVDLFRRAEAVVHATPHLLYLARANVKLGDLVQAREHYLAIVNEGLPPGANDFLKETRSTAESELEALEPRVPRVTIVVQGDNDDGLVVTMDDGPVLPALLGVPQPLNPGTHRFKAVTHTAESSVTALEVREGARETVMLTLRPGATAASGGNHAGASEADSGTAGGTSGMRIGAYAAFGVGAVGVGLGTLFLFQHLSVQSDADDLYAECKKRADCGTPSVRDAVEEKDDEAESKALLAGIGYGVGALGIGTGIALLLLDDGGKTESGVASIRPWFGISSAGVSGRF